MTKPTDNQEINQMLSVILESLKEKKAQDLVSIDFKSLNLSLCDYFVIAHATSTTQVHAMAHHIQDQMKEKLGMRPAFVEGMENAEWIILDYLDIVIHLFLEDSRKFYDLESLWADAALEHHYD